MATERQAHQEVRDMWHRAHWSPARTWTSWPG
jgi:hypothetical protein